MLRLVSEDGSVLNEHLAGHGTKQWYEFAVAEAHRSPRIERRPHGPYAVQRSPEGGAVLRKRGSGRTPVPARGQVPLTGTLHLSLGEDSRPPKNGGRTRPEATPTPGAGPGGGAFTDYE